MPRKKFQSSPGPHAAFEDASQANRFLVALSYIGQAGKLQAR